jgi:hypothetical protein
MEEKTIKDHPQQDRIWKVSRWGVIAFCILHFYFEIVTKNNRFIQTGEIAPVLFNFLISRWWIKTVFTKPTKTIPLLFKGFFCSVVVFLFRIALGVVYTLATIK